MLRAIILCFVSAFLLILSFSSFNIWICAWFGFLPLFFALRDQSKRRAFLFSYFTGLIFWSGTIYWLIHVTLLGQIILIMYLALYFGIFGALFSILSRRCNKNPIILIPAIWVLLEYLRSYLLTGFPWALLALSQFSNLSVIQIADMTGAWGVSFLVMMVNVAIYRVVSPRLISPGKILLPIICILAVLTYGYLKLRPETGKTRPVAVKLSVIQANIPQELKWSKHAKRFIFDAYASLTKEAAEARPDLIIWPEAASPDVAGEEDFVFSGILGLSRSTKIPMLIGAVVAEKGNYFNSALLVNTQGLIQQRYDKIHLVPFGEYIPLRKALPFLETVAPIGDINRGRDYVIFKTQGAGGLAQTGFGALICFEDLFPELSREFVKRGARFLAVLTNDAWYKKSSASLQHYQASVFRAVENRVLVVRAANTGISGFIAPNGRTISQIRDESGRNIFIRGILTENISIPEQAPATIYNRFGDIFIFLLLIYAIYSIFQIR